MGVTVQIVKDENYDSDKVKMFWTPFKLKFQDRPEFKFVEVDPWDSVQEDNHVSIPWHYAPTYKGMLHLERLSAEHSKFYSFAVDELFDKLCYDIREYE